MKTKSKQKYINTTLSSALANNVAPTSSYDYTTWMYLNSNVTMKELCTLEENLAPVVEAV